MTMTMTDRTLHEDSGRKKVHYDSGPNMTPLVDVVMVILIFLMLAGSFVGAEHFLVSNLPFSADRRRRRAAAAGVHPRRAAGHPRRHAPPPATASSRPPGRSAPATPSTLTAQLRSMRQQLNAAGKTDDKIQVKIGPGKNVKYKYLVAVYEAALNAGFKKVAFATSH